MKTISEKYRSTRFFSGDLSQNLMEKSGCIVSFILFNIYIEKILAKAEDRKTLGRKRITNLRNADNTVISPAHKRNSFKYNEYAGQDQ